jgi:hypothetical protein
MVAKLKWYLARLSSMSLSEIGYRIRYHAKVEVDRRKFIQPSHVELSVALAKEWLHFQAETTPFYFSWTNRDRLTHLMSEEFPAEKQAMLHRADMLLAHHIELFGRSFQLSEQIDWQHDPVSGNAWPAKFWADIDTRDAKKIGGVKWVWELNRHHHLVTLGKAYFLTNDERYAAELCSELLSWIAANPPGYGVNWTSPLEMALRIINWTWALALIRRSSALDGSLFNNIVRTIEAQAQHIERYLSAHSSANNHLIGEAAGLATVALTFPWMRNASHWQQLGLQTLERELTLQIHADGVPAEQAIHYLLFILDFNVTTWRLAELHGITIPSVVREKLEVACEFIAHLMDENGNVPQIGDSDDAWVVRLDDRPETNNFRSILATAAVMFQRPDFKAAAGSWDEKSQWLLGDEGRMGFQNLSDTAVPLTSRAFGQGGYSVMRGAGRVVTFDHGPLGYLSTAAHGHADALSITVSINGQPLLVDPGTYAYQEGGTWRTYLRSTSAHNTVVVNGADQSEMRGTFLWGHKANTNLLHWQTTPEVDIVVAEHDGYKTQSVVHRRSVFFEKPHWLFVIDSLSGDSTKIIQQFWHFPNNSIYEKVGEWHHVSLHGQSLALLQLGEQKMSSNFYQGLESPIRGWMSAHYGHLAPAPVLVFEGSTQLPMTLITAVAFDAGELEQDVEAFGRRTRARIDLLQQQVNL